MFFFLLVYLIQFIFDEFQHTQKYTLLIDQWCIFLEEPNEFILFPYGVWQQTLIESSKAIVHRKRISTKSLIDLDFRLIFVSKIDFGYRIFFYFSWIININNDDCQIFAYSKWFKIMIMMNRRSFYLFDKKIEILEQLKKPKGKVND